VQKKREREKERDRGREGESREEEEQSDKNDSSESKYISHGANEGAKVQAARDPDFHFSDSRSHAI